MLERLFKIKERGSTVRIELLAGVTTFMTMAYIIFVNPAILNQAGIPLADAVTATCLTAGLATILMGLYANYPFALAAGMGMNALVVFTFAAETGLKSWQAAMTVIFIEGVIISILVLTHVRELVMEAIPTSLKRAIGVGIGLFIAFIGLHQGRIVQQHPVTLVTFAEPHNVVAALTIAGLFVTAALMMLRVRTAILLGIVFTTVVALVFGLVRYQGHVQLPQWPATFAKMDFTPFFSGGLILTAWAFVFAALMVDFFDTMGTVIAVGGEAGMLDKDGKLPGLRRVLLADSLAAVFGGIFGASSNTTYIESAAGVAEGGRTGLSSIVTGLLFFAGVFFVPVISMIGGGVKTGGSDIIYYPLTAPALIIVGFLMVTVVKDIPFSDISEGLPAFMTIILIPLTYSISHGIGYGFITYVVLRLLSGKWRTVHPLMYIVSALFALSFVLR